MSDLTMNARQRDGHRGQRGEDTEGSGQLEEIGVVDNIIYESVYDIISGPQEDMRDTQGQRSQTLRNPDRVVAVCLGMLCLILLGVIVGQTVKHHSDSNLTNCDNLTTKYNKLTLEKDQLDTKYYNLTLEKEKLEANLTLLQCEVNHRNGTMCPSRWERFGCSCYLRSDEKNRKDWNESRAECLKTPGADLVIINSKAEQEFVKGFIQDEQTGSWIGMNRTGVEWTWVDGTPLKTQYWENPLSNSGCVYSYPNGKSYNGECSIPRTWICEK